MKIHFISIGGSIMHQLALVLKSEGHTVSGSDDEIYEPSRSILQKAGLLPTKMGWNADNITSDLDCVILGMHAKKDNPELKKAQKLKIPIYSYPEYIFRHAADKQRVVVAGSHGKTTITAALMHVFKELKKDFDYLVGARLEGFAQSVKLSDASMMVLEGDEYLSSALHRVPKIHFYKPQVALLSGIAWDHMNVFPTFKNYKEQFSIFLNSMAADSVIIYNEEDENVCEVVEKATHLTKIAYKTPKFTQESGKVSWQTEHGDIPLHIFGQHNLQNLAGAQKVCEQIGISSKDFFKTIQSFKGASKRLDLIGENEHSVIFRDFAHAPSKVKATTEAMSSLYKKRRLVACFELHTYSSLNIKFLPQYKGALASAEKAVVYFDPHTLDIKKLPALDVDTVKACFERDDLVVVNSQKQLLAYLKRFNWKNTNLLLMSSGKFGGVKNEDIVNFVI